MSGGCAVKKLSNAILHRWPGASPPVISCSCTISTGDRTSHSFFWSQCRPATSHHDHQCRPATTTNLGWLVENPHGKQGHWPAKNYGHQIPTNGKISQGHTSAPISHHLRDTARSVGTTKCKCDLNPVDATTNRNTDMLSLLKVPVDRPLPWV